MLVIASSLVYLQLINNMKKLFLTALFAFLCLSALAKEIRVIYVWDVTLSMQGKGGENIWDKTKSAINTSISDIYDKTTEIVVIPFQHRLITEDQVSALGNESGKKGIMNFVSNYEIPRLWKGTDKDGSEDANGTTTMTKLHEPLNAVIEQYLKVNNDGKRNVILFLSDGQSEKNWQDDQQKFEELIKSPELCQLLGDKDSYLFYFALTKTAENADVRDYILKDPCSGKLLYVAPDAKTGSSSLVIYSMLVELPRELEYNVKYQYNKPILVKLQNTASAPSVFKTLGYKLHVSLPDNEYFHAFDEDVVIGEDLAFELNLKPKKAFDQMGKLVSGEGDYVCLDISVPDEMKKEYPYNMTSLDSGSDKIALKVYNSKQNRLDISSTGATGSYEYFPTWGLWPFSYYTADPIRIKETLTVATYSDASAIKGDVVLAVCDQYRDKVSPEMVEMYVDGEKSEDNTIVISLDQQMDCTENREINVEFALTQAAIDTYNDDHLFKYHLEVVAVPDALYKINEQPAQAGLDLADLSVGMDVDYTVNTLKVWTITILIILLSALIAIIVLVQISVKRFNVTHLTKIFVSENDLRRCIMGCKAGLKGTTEIILTSDRNKKQGFWAMLFKGKKSYVYIANLPAEISLNVGSKGRISHAVRSKTANVMADFDVPGKRMILSCKSETFGTEYKIEYPRK